MVLKVRRLCLLYTEPGERAEKIARLRLILPLKGAEIEVGIMGGTEKKSDTENRGKSKTPPPKTIEEDDVEDGDIATPKRGIDGDDDQPL